MISKPSGAGYVPFAHRSTGHPLTCAAAYQFEDHKAGQTSNVDRLTNISPPIGRKFANMEISRALEPTDLEERVVASHDTGELLPTIS